LRNRSLRNLCLLSLASATIIMSAAVPFCDFDVDGGTTTSGSYSSSMAASGPDLSINESDLLVQASGLNISTTTYGQFITVRALIYNMGDANASEFVVQFGWRSDQLAYNSTFWETGSLSANVSGGYLYVNYSFYVGLTLWGDYEVWTWVDPLNNVSESDESNNFVVRPLVVEHLNMVVTITTDEAEYSPGDDIYLVATMTYGNSSDRVHYPPWVVFMLVDMNTGAEVPNTRTVAVNGSSDGVVVQVLTVPIDLPKGLYTIRAEVLGVGYESTTPLVLEIAHHPNPPSLLLLLSIAAIVIMVAVGLVLYVFFRGRKAKPSP
jgi:hypothetical protein